MTKFRPCIDLHDGKVKQIVGGSLRDDGSAPEENFVSGQDADWFAEKFRKDDLAGGHVIMLGPGNEEAARRVALELQDRFAMAGTRFAVRTESLVANLLGSGGGGR